jgi:hypothetical protein
MRHIAGISGDERKQRVKSGCTSSKQTEISDSVYGRLSTLDSTQLDADEFVFKSPPSKLSFDFLFIVAINSRAFSLNGVCTALKLLAFDGACV